MKISIKDITYNAIIAALYVVLTLVTYPISFLGIQFRVAEILVLLCFYRRDYVIGLTLGCIIANLFSAIGMLDAIFGAIATLLSCLAVSFCRHLVVACLLPVVLNGFAIGIELYALLGELFWISVGTVALGELAVLVVGYVVFTILKHNQTFLKLIRAQQNIDFKW